MNWFDWFLVAWFLYGGLITVAHVGKVREPIRPLTAAIVVLIQAILIAVLLVTRGGLS